MNEIEMGDVRWEMGDVKHEMLMVFSFFSAIAVRRRGPSGQRLGTGYGMIRMIPA